jgi:hypothetical protein
MVKTVDGRFRQENRPPGPIRTGDRPQHTDRKQSPGKIRNLVSVPTPATGTARIRGIMPRLMMGTC